MSTNFQQDSVMYLFLAARSSLLWLLAFFGDVFLSFTPNTFIPFLVNVWVFLGRDIIWSIVFTRVLNQFKDIHALGFRHSPLLEKVSRHTKQGNTSINNFSKKG